jgi:hypothetical protein
VTTEVGLEVHRRIEVHSATSAIEHETSGVALALRTGVPTFQVEDEEGRTHLLIHLPIEEEDEDRWCLWRSDHAGFDSTSVFEGALIPAPRKEWL